ncbi:MAG: heterodisulfide reductase, partial [Chloroflexi bacterium]|nr:heterodisulfide reductase [Chloroflexota bacterium]
MKAATKKLNGHIAQAIRALLDQGYEGVLGLRRRWGHVGPHVYTRGESLDDVVVQPRYPMANVLRRLLAAKPNQRLGVVARGCDVRAIQALVEDKLLPPDAVAFVGVICSEDQAITCNCEKPI